MTPPGADHDRIHRDIRRGPARIAGIYAVVASLWILLSDGLAATIIHDPHQLAMVGAIKGWAFVALTSLLLFSLTRRMMMAQAAAHARLVEAQAERLEALRLLEVLSEKSTDAIYVKDTEGHYLLFNREAGRFVGRDAAEVIGLDDRALFPPDEAEKLRAHDRAIIADGEVRTFEESLTTPKGVVHFLTTKGPIYDDRHGLIGLFGIARDITDRVAVEAAMREKTEQLMQSNADLEQFAYVASHDLQTPLRNIVSYAQLLEHRYGGKLDQDADDFIRFIVDSGKQMSALIADLLEYSRLTSHMGEPVPVDANAAARQAVGLLGPMIEATGAEVTVDPLPRVRAEHAPLVSLFQNLLTNGLKYRTPGRPPRLSITAEPDGAGFWRLAVRDNGIGIDPAYHDKIFEIFQRLRPTAETEGTGIGLTLCRRIVHRFGGTIWVESTPDHGATFFFRLPAA